MSVPALLDVQNPPAFLEGTKIRDPVLRVHY